MKFFLPSLLLASLVFCGAVFGQIPKSNQTKISSTSEAAPVSNKETVVGTGDAEGTGVVNEGNMPQEGTASATKKSEKPSKNLAETPKSSRKSGFAPRAMSEASARRKASSDKPTVHVKSAKSTKKRSLHHKSRHHKTSDSAQATADKVASVGKKKTLKSSKSHHKSRPSRSKTTSSSAKTKKEKSAVPDDKIGADQPEPSDKN